MLAKLGPYEWLSLSALFPFTALTVLRVGAPSMVLAIALRRQARVCIRLAEDFDDQHLAERLRAMAANLVAKADDIEELPGDCLRQLDPLMAA